MLGRSVLLLSLGLAATSHADTFARFALLTPRPAVRQAVPIPLIPNLGAKIAKLNRVSPRKGNLNGDVFVLQYHGITPTEKRYDRSRANFWNDLDRIYKLGFRPVTLTEYVENKMVLPPGASPVVITFDDAKSSQFYFLKDGSIDPNCAVGIWKRFWEAHPDFPIKGMWYVTTSMMWGQKDLVDKKIKMLLDWGSEIGDHTISHPPLSKLSEAAATREIGFPAAYLEKKGITQHLHFCMPYGLFPRNHKLVQEVKFNGKTYKFESNTLCGANPAPAPTSKKFNPYRIPRILCNNESDGINTWVAKAQKGKLNLYVEP